MQTLDAQPAGSSPAESPAPTALRSLDSMSKAERDSWRLTGKQPEAAPSSDADVPAESSPAEPAAQAASTDAQTQAASEPAAAGKKKGVKTRNEELDAEIAALNEKLRERAMLRARVAELDQPAAQPPTQDVSPGSSPGAVAAEDFPDFDAWAAKPENAGQPYERYVRELARHEYRAEMQQQQRVQAVQTRVEQFRTRVTQAAQADPQLWADLAPEVVNLRPIDDLRPGERPTALNVLAQEIVQSEHAPQLLRHFSRDRAAFARVASMSFADVVREVGRLEARLSTPSQSAFPAIPVSRAPEPPVTLGSKPAAPVDEVDGALSRRDFAAYRDAQNRRELGR